MRSAAAVTTQRGHDAEAGRGQQHPLGRLRGAEVRRRERQGLAEQRAQVGADQRQRGQQRQHRRPGGGRGARAAPTTAASRPGGGGAGRAGPAARRASPTAAWPGGTSMRSSTCQPAAGVRTSASEAASRRGTAGSPPHEPLVAVEGAAGGDEAQLAAPSAVARDAPSRSPAPAGLRGRPRRRGRRGGAAERPGPPRRAAGGGRGEPSDGVRRRPNPAGGACGQHTGGRCLPSSSGASGPLHGEVVAVRRQELGAQADGGHHAGRGHLRAAQRARHRRRGLAWPTCSRRWGLEVRRTGPGELDDRPARRPRARGALRAGRAHAGLDRRARPAAGPLRPGPGGPARRRRLRAPARSTCTSRALEALGRRGRRWPTATSRPGPPRPASAPASCSSSRASAPPRTR